MTDKKVNGYDEASFKDAYGFPMNVRKSTYRPTKCRNCGYDIKGLYGSDRKAHTDGWCGN